MFEMIKVDVINGSKKSYKDCAGMQFASRPELNAFRKKIQAEYPDYEVYLTYKDLRQPTPATA